MTKLTEARLITLKKGTTIVLVFDTDTNKTDILEKNLRFLERQKGLIKEIILITQVSNLEDELIRSCNIREIRELTGSRSNTEFKGDLLKTNNLKAKLDKKSFDFNKFWIANAHNDFQFINNDASKVKLK